MDAPWGVCAVERQYWDRQASLARPFDSADGRFDLQLTWFAGVDLGVSETSGGRARRRQEGARGTGVEHGGAGLSEMANWLLSSCFGLIGARQRGPAPSGSRPPARAASRSPRRLPPPRQPRTTPVILRARRREAIAETVGTRGRSTRRYVPTRTVSDGWSWRSRFASPPCSACRLRRCFSSRRRL